MQPLYDFYSLYAAEITLTLAAATLLLLLWVLGLQIRMMLLNRRYRAAMRGVDGTDLEGALRTLNRGMSDHQSRLATLEQRYESTEKRVAKHAGKVGMVRFNPFNDTGSDQSFTIAWLDSEANGVVISSLYSRAGMRVYAKPLVRGESTYSLTEEERQAIANAVSR